MCDVVTGALCSREVFFVVSVSPLYSKLLAKLNAEN